MAKNKLTNKQQTIVNNMITHFVNINGLPVKGNLIDIASIIDKTELIAKRDEEIQLQRSAFEQVKLEAALKDFERIKDDIENLGLKISMDNCGYCIYVQRKDKTKAIEMSVRYVNHKEIELANQHRDYISTFSCGVNYKLNLHTDMYIAHSFGSLEGMVDSKEFKDKLQKMYEYLIKHKK